MLTGQAVTTSLCRYNSEQIAPLCTLHDSESGHPCASHIESVSEGTARCRTATVVLFLPVGPCFIQTNTALVVHSNLK